MTNLETRSRELIQVITDIALDDCNIVQSNIHLDERRKVREEDLAEASWHYETTSRAGFFVYEDAGMTTAALLAGESLRYGVTGDPQARQTARRAFEGIRSIYRLGQAKVEGYFPKRYGKALSDQISRDQYLFVMRGMSHFYDIADEAERNEIRRMFGKMAEYWMSINYSHGYMGWPVSSQLTDFMGSLFLGILRLAAAYSGEERFLVEYRRLFQEERLGHRMPETLTAQFQQGRTYDGAMYFRQNENCIMLKTIALDFLWDADQAHRELWTKSLRAFHDEDLLVQLDRESGLTYYITGFDPRSGGTFLTRPGPIEELEDPLNLQWIRFGGLRKTPGSTQVAFSSLVIGDRLKLPEAVRVAHMILEKMTLDKFRNFTVPDQSHLPPNQVWEQHFATVLYMGVWVWTYWLGRARGFW